MSQLHLIMLQLQFQLLVTVAQLLQLLRYLQMMPKMFHNHYLLYLYKCKQLKIVNQLQLKDWSHQMQA